MAMTPKRTRKRTDYVAPWSRVLILAGSVAVLASLARWATGAWLPTGPQDAFIFQSALLTIVLGSAIIEHHYTEPADALVNALMGALTLLSSYSITPSAAWWSLFILCLLVLAASSLCVALSGDEAAVGWRASASKVTFGIATTFGKARVLFSALLLYSVFAFYGVQDKRTAALVVFWGVFVSLWPLQIPQILSRFLNTEARPTSIGSVLLAEAPHLVRIGLTKPRSFGSTHPLLLAGSDGSGRVVVPLYTQTEGAELLTTAITYPFDGQLSGDLKAGEVYEFPEADIPTTAEVSAGLGGRSDTSLLGFVLDGSTIAELRVQALPGFSWREGALICCRVRERRVFYQVTNGETASASFSSQRHSFQVAIAAQVGELDSALGFAKSSWIPQPHSPVFAVTAEDFPSAADSGDDSLFTYGQIPGTTVPVTGDFVGNLDHHTALLGVTGSGKTELALDLIRHAASKGVLVFCVDLTSKYSTALNSLAPVDLSPSSRLCQELSEKLFAVETGAYSAGTEKRALREFSDSLRAEAMAGLNAFLGGTSGAGKVGVLTLREIANSKATLHITELYLSCVLQFARENPSAARRILVVLEEAHTVVPEPATMGLGDFDSKGLVARISQIALQGRKFGVGLLVIAQRTATVSKSVLTQCNTIISFACVDDTSLGFLRNLFGSAQVELIPNLPRLNAIGFGKAIRSERPIRIEIPFDAGKVNNDN